MLSLIVDSRLRLPLGQLSPGLLEKIKKEFEFKNPQYYINKARNYSNYKTPEVIKAHKQTKKELTLPRGTTSNVISLLEDEGIEYQVINKTRMLPKVDFEFHGELRETQIEPVEAILSRKFSTLSAPPGSGKTTISLYTVAKRSQKTLVIVHTKALLVQWQERIEQFLGIDRKDIGTIVEGKIKLGEKITVGMVQTLTKCSHKVKPYIGYIICDECHHQPAKSFSDVVSVFDSAYSVGLSATHVRRDKLERLIAWYLGPIVSVVGLNDLIKQGNVMMVEPIIRETNFRSNLMEPSWSNLISELILDEERNLLIANDVVKESKKGPCVVLSDRKAHCEILTSLIDSFGIDVEMVTGDVKGEDRDNILKKLKEKKIDVIVATGQLLGEGFDEKSLTALFLTTPISWAGRLTQYLGRISRICDGKTRSVAYDYKDTFCDYLMKAFEERMRTYRKLKKQSLKK